MDWICIPHQKALIIINIDDLVMFHTMHVSVMSVMSNEYLLPYAIMKDVCISQALLGGSMNPSTKLNAMAAHKEGLVCRHSPQHRLPATRHIARAAAAAPATVNIDSWVEDSRRSREQWLEVTNSFFPPLQQNKSLSSYPWLPILSNGFFHGPLAAHQRVYSGLDTQDIY